MHKWFIAILIMALFRCSVRGQETELKSSKAKAAVREYERKLEDVDKEIAKQLEDLKKSYQMKAELVRARLLSNLNEAMKEEIRKINLQEANKIKALVESIEKAETSVIEKLINETKKKHDTKTRSKIPQSAVQFKGHHYAVVTKAMSPYDARLYAEGFGAHLLRIETEREHIFVTKLIQGFQGARDIAFWIDGSDGITEGQWMYSNREPVRYWPTDSPPDNTHNSEHNVEIHKSGHLNDYSLARQPFVIEWDK